MSGKRERVRGEKTCFVLLEELFGIPLLLFLSLSLSQFISIQLALLQWHKLLQEIAKIMSILSQESILYSHSN